MPIVESDPKGERKPLGANLDPDTFRRLKNYERFSRAKREKIVRTALLRLFEQDDEFARFEAQESSAPTPSRRASAAAQAS